jgi:hypothetical protein
MLKSHENLAGATGLEPATSSVTGQRESNEYNVRFNFSPDTSGHKACDSTSEGAKVESLKPPPPPPVERQMEQLGVSPKQKERARQTFMKSAQYAGFIDSDGTDGLELDPLLIALLKKVPSPEKGWPGPARVRWFRTFAMNMSQIYDGEGQPVEMKIEIDKEAAE